MPKIHALSVVGARPQFIKAAAIDRAIARISGMTHSVLHTGQHYDERMSQVFFDELGIPKADIDLGVGSGPHGAQTARMLAGIEEALIKLQPDAVLLYGDTNSTLAGAMAAAKLHLPIAHIEAGLRSFRKSMPEEINRVLCDHCSTWLFCPTQLAVENLVREGFRNDSHGEATSDNPRLLMCGDVMYDNSLHFSGMAAERSTILEEYGLKSGDYFLATVHRDHNTDAPNRLSAIMLALAQAAVDHRFPLVLPMHPRTRDRLQAEGSLASLGDRIRILPPIGYLDMLALERHARLIVTDSGGVQKESFFFDKPCVVLRAETEWVELVEHGQAVLTDADPQRIRNAIAGFMEQGKPACPPLYGDGRAADRIIAELASSLS
jgi:UDP-GlcNAc3NAcA epimerase